MAKIKNVFEKQSEFKPQFKRNLINLTHRNNLSFNFGQLIPCMCKEVLPGDTFRIDSASLFKAMPLNFPVQTAMKAYVHYYYVRNRVLMDRWEDYITGVTGDDVTPAFFRMTPDNYQHMFTTGSLGDYLGIPTRLTGTKQLSVDIKQPDYLKGKSYWIINRYYPTQVSTGGLYDFAANVWNITSTLTNQARQALMIRLNTGDTRFNFADDLSDVSNYTNISYSVETYTNGTEEIQVPSYIFHFDNIRFTNREPLAIWLVYRDSSGTIHPFWTSTTGGDASGDIIDEFNIRIKLVDLVRFISQVPDDCDLYLMVSSKQQDSTSQTIEDFITIYDNKTSGITYGVDVTNEELTLDTNPLRNEMFNVLPFRAYEMICNYFYRNERVNPLYIDGKPVYNEFLPSKSTGLDGYVYQLHNRNWVSDFLTSAVPSPQMGIAPLVGVSSNVDSVTFEFELDTALGDAPAGTKFTVTSNLDESGNLTGISAYDDITPTGNLQRLRDVISQGISINDLRNASAFQRFLENSLRRGYKYIDNMLAHYGVAPDKVAIQAPEFIGGYTMDINVRQITTTASTEQGNAGDISGQMEISGSLKRKITHYCPEHGYIMGIISVAPMPAYQQVMPKYFFKLNKLDYFFPEFGKIGMQPIMMKEVAPLQTAPEHLNDTFGYQRPWYDYLGAVDEVHGAFRSSLKDFILTRTFSEIPELGEDFVTVKDEYLNDIWATKPNHDADGHKFFGNMIHDVKVKRQIPVTSVMGEIL